MADLTKTRHPGIYKRGTRYVIVYRDRQGKQRRETVDTLAEAQTVKAERVAAVKGGTHREGSKQRLDDYLRAWIQTYAGVKGGGFRENTRKAYARLLELYVIPHLGHLTLAELTTADVRGFGHWLHDAEAQGKRRAEATRKAKAERLGVAPSTLPLEVKPVVLADRSVAKIISPLSAALTTAVNDALIDRNPVRDAVIPKRDQQRAIDEGRELEPEAAKALTDAELVAFMQACPEHWHPFFALLAGTGLRVSEVIALRWQDVDLDGENPQVRVTRAYANDTLGLPKSKASRRSVPISRALVRQLKAQHAATEWPDPGHLVFPSEAGTFLCQRNLRKRVLLPTAKAAGLVRAPRVGKAPVPWVGFHSFRHTCATRLFREGRNAEQVRKWLGHSSAAFTIEVYVHLLDDDLGGPLELPDPELAPVPEGSKRQQKDNRPPDTGRHGATNSREGFPVVCREKVA